MMKGDTISRSALIAEIKKWTTDCACIELIENEPAVAAAPEVHGRWIEEGDIQICSNCGEEHEWQDYRAPYCDNCGARMDGGEGE